MIESAGSPAVAFLDDDPSFVEALAQWQTVHGLPRLASTRKEDVLQWVSSGEVSTVVSDLRMPDIDGISFLEQVKKIAPSTSLVLCTGFSPTSREMSRLDRLGASVVSKSDLPLFFEELKESFDRRTRKRSRPIAEGEFRPSQPSEELHTVFLSYGGPDEEMARAVYQALTAKGADVFFFPESALPGQRLHRTMCDGIQDHDRVVLLCSGNSLLRAGVLNELEQVLAREAAEGGAELLIPIALDDYVYTAWAPARADLGRQVRNRVIADFRNKRPGTKEFDSAIERVVTALTKREVA